MTNQDREERKMAKDTENFKDDARIKALEGRKMVRNAVESTKEAGEKVVDKTKEMGGKIASKAEEIKEDVVNGGDTKKATGSKMPGNGDRH